MGKVTKPNTAHKRKTDEPEVPIAHDPGRIEAHQHSARINRAYVPPAPAEEDDDQDDDTPTPKQQTRMPKTKTKAHDEDD